MSQKQLRFLSDGTLCSLFSQGSVETKPTIDPILFSEFIKKDRMRTLKNQKIHKFIIGLLLITVVFPLGFFVFNFINEGILGIFLTISFVGILMTHYLFFPQEDRTKKANKEYRETFFSLIKKEGVIKNLNDEEVFNALMLRVRIIIHDETVKNKLYRLEKIITKINEYEDSKNKIFKIPIKLATNIGEIRYLFQSSEVIPQWAQQFIQRHSMQNSFLHETAEELKETPEEILA